MCLDMEIPLNLGSFTRKKSTRHGQTPELCGICWSNDELNRQLRGRAINCNVTEGLSDGIITNKINASL